MALQHQIQAGLFLVCLVFLAFIGGAAVMTAEVFPSGYVRDAHRAATALISKLRDYDDIYRTDLWYPARSGASGVTVHKAQQAYPGLTLYTSGDAPHALLIDMDGDVVHAWSMPFSKVWEPSAAVEEPVPDERIYLRKAHVFPNGDLLAIYIGVGDAPYGYGMVKLDKDSRVLWKYLERTHHDFAVADDGRIYALTHEIRHEPLPGVDHIDPPMIEDFLVVLSPEGEELKRISLLESASRQPYRQLLWLIGFYSLSDPLHTNGVDYIDAAAAERLPFAEQGDVMLSFRELGSGTLAVMDVDRERLAWVRRGPWIGQHDPDILPNGRLLLFDNNGHLGPGGRSRVIELEPGTGEITWSYAGDEEHFFESRLRAAQQRLPNGNTLITETNGGRLLEVSRAGEIVWEFVNPVRGGADDEYIPVVSWGQRIVPESLDAGWRVSMGID